MFGHPILKETIEEPESLLQGLAVMVAEQGLETWL